MSLPSKAVTVLQVVSGLHPCAGGPSRTITQLCDALALVPNVQVTLLTQGLIGEPIIEPQELAVDLRVIDTSFRSILRTGFPVRDALCKIEINQRPSLIHSNGLWVMASHWAARAARRWNTPLVIQPHGMLAPWALEHKGRKKRIAMVLYQRRDLETAKVLIATSTVEYENIRRLGFRQPIAIIPNGVKINPSVSVNAKSEGKHDFRTVLFLSRIHPVKGVLNLVEAWSLLAPANWRLRIAGPDEGGHLAEVMSMVQRSGIAETIEYVGTVDGNQKEALYRDADVFVLPSFTENFGVVVAEALSYGLPVITTKGAPWADLETYRCGWWVDIGVEPLVAALRNAMALDDAELLAMGERGKAYVQRYNWTDIARQTAEVYRWVLGEAAMPNCVHVDCGIK